MRTEPARDPQVYKTDYSTMPKAWVDSAMGNSDEPVATPEKGVEFVPTIKEPVVETSKPTGNYPWGTPVPGKTGLVASPYSNQGYVDVKGMIPGSMAKDPYTGKIFLVP